MSAQEMRNMRTLMGVYNMQDEGYSLHGLDWDKVHQCATMWIQPKGCDEVFLLEFETLESFVERFPEVYGYYARLA